MIDTVCEWSASTLYIFSENVGALVYYTHIFPLVISLFLGFQVLINNPKRLSNQVLFLLTIVFSIWVYFDLILWASPTPEAVMFFWSAIVPVEMLMYLLAIYLMYLFAHDQKDMPTWQKVGYSLFLLPIILFGHTSLNVIGLSPDCDTGAFEGVIIQYMYLVELILIAVAMFMFFKGRKRITERIARKKLTYVGIATIVFLLFFSAGNLTLSFDLSPFYEQYKLFGMPVFVAIVSYSMVKFGTFTVKTVLTEVLISALWILMFSMLLFSDIAYARPVILVSVVAFGFIGIQLARSARKENAQSLEIQKLAANLEKANNRFRALDKQKSEFVTIASHQLRSPLTAIRGYSSLLKEGSFGVLPQKALEPIGRIEESSKLMAMAIEDYLNVSQIESGNMNYNLSDFNLRDQTEHLCDDMRSEAIKHGLILLFRTHLSSRAVVHADLGKTVQIVQNLINNAIKYTKEGTIIVIVRDDIKKKKIFVDVTDTGIGMSEETQHILFQKFSRAHNANTMNVSGNGLGLFVADKMAEAMGGDIQAYSEGEGKGSRFTFCMPFAL